MQDRLIALLQRFSLRTGNFTLSSGKKSSYYIDARRTTMSAEGLEVIGTLGREAIREAGWAVTRVGGMTLGADPVAYAIALASRRAPPVLDAFTVRKDAKTHGTGQLIEGCFQPGDQVAIVEDVLTTGGSALQAAAAVEAGAGVVAGVLVVVDREEGGAAAVAHAGYKLRSLVSLRDLGVLPA